VRFIAPEVKISPPAALPVNGRPRACPVGAVPLDPLAVTKPSWNCVGRWTEPGRYSRRPGHHGYGRGPGLGFGGCCRPEL